MISAFTQIGEINYNWLFIDIIKRLNVRLCVFYLPWNLDDRWILLNVDPEHGGRYRITQFNFNDHWWAQGGRNKHRIWYWIRLRFHDIDLKNLTDSDWEDFTFDSDRKTSKLKFYRGESVTGKIQKMKNSTIIISRKRRQQHTRSKTQEIDFEIGIILNPPTWNKNSRISRIQFRRWHTMQVHDGNGMRYEIEIYQSLSVC